MTNYHPHNLILFEFSLFFGMKKLDNKCTIVANSLILSDSVFLRFFKKAFENLKKSKIYYFLLFIRPSRCKKKSNQFWKKNTSPAYDKESNSNFENLLKQEITNLAIFSSFQKLSFKHLKNEIRQNQGICHNGTFVV